MKRTRKKYLVFKTNQAGEGTVMGVFSSGKKAEAAIMADAKQQIQRVSNGENLHSPYYEKRSGQYRLTLSPGNLIVYRIENREEDSLCDSQIKV